MRRVAIPLALLLLFAPLAAAQEAADFFRQSCASCHTIGGGRLTGPDLKDVEQRKDRAWLARFITNPTEVINSGDPYAARLVQDSRGVVMPVAPGITSERAGALLDLIAAESKLEKSRFAGLDIGNQPFTDADIRRGRALFRGDARLKNAGAACISCHTVRGLGGLSGGRLGPDLTRVYERLQGRKALASWMFAPATPTMATVYRTRAMQPDEIVVLTAFFEDAARTGGQDNSASLLNFFLLGLGGAALALVLFDAAWKKRFRGVRRLLVHPNVPRGEE